MRIVTTMTSRKPGPGSCSVCNAFSELELRSIHLRLDSQSIKRTAEQIGVHPASLRRHALNHRNRGVVRTVLLTESLDAFDFIDSLASAYLDADKIRAESLRRGTTAGYTLALRSMRTQQQIARQLHDSLGIDAATYTARDRDQQHLSDAIVRLLRRRPTFAHDLAEFVEGDDDLVAELQRIGATEPKEAAA